jgi:hypothetical protein
MTTKQLLAEIRKNPLGKEILSRAYKIRRDISADIHRTVEKLILPDDDMLCFSLVMSTQNMGLEMGTYVEFAPTSGMVGPCKLWGNSLPVFEYKVFHAQPVMEFIKIKVEVAKPDRIHFTAHIDSLGTADPKDHGKAMEIVEAYRKPFYILANHLYNFFPFGRDPACTREAVMFAPSQEEMDKIQAAFDSQSLGGPWGPLPTAQDYGDNVKELPNGAI